jgi:hypothetical protein
MARECPNLDTIFCTAIAIASVEDRAAYISQACGGDHELRGQVERLGDSRRAGPGRTPPAASPIRFRGSGGARALATWADFSSPVAGVKPGARGQNRFTLELGVPRRSVPCPPQAPLSAPMTLRPRGRFAQVTARALRPLVVIVAFLRIT